jgi:hypothetical protein
MIAVFNTGSRLVRKLFVIVWLGIAISAQSQDVRVEKSVFGVQTGFLGIWGHGEFRISNKFALRIEAGLDGSFWDGTMFEKTGFVLEPVITIEPRWYYNLAEREHKSKSVRRNSGNFISVKCSFQPDWFVISNDDYVNRSRDIVIIPTWGIRRNMGKHFNYEAGFGVGYQYIFDSQTGGPENEGSVAYNVLLRAGFNF